MSEIEKEKNKNLSLFRVERFRQLIQMKIILLFYKLLFLFLLLLFNLHLK